MNSSKQEPSKTMKMVLLSGMSGSGKTVALHTLEDAGYFCVDNLPLVLLPEFVRSMQRPNSQDYENIAIAIDARSGDEDIRKLDHFIEEIKPALASVKILFLTSDDSALLKRFSETRRKHPLSSHDLPLIDAIRQERTLLKDISAHADLSIDTSTLNVHELRQTIVKRLLPSHHTDTAILIQSFGFKHGLPADTDFVFDVRCLPNPHWENHLKVLTGRDSQVIEYLEGFKEVKAMLGDLLKYADRWIPSFIRESRSYITISIGCTGGRHRSVYLTEQLKIRLQEKGYNVSLKHRDLK
jgi:RNase adapter protein RapZ